MMSNAQPWCSVKAAFSVRAGARSIRGPEGEKCAEVLPTPWALIRLTWVGLACVATPISANSGRMERHRHCIRLRAKNGSPLSLPGGSLALNAAWAVGPGVHPRTHPVRQVVDQHRALEHLQAPEDLIPLHVAIYVSRTQERCEDSAGLLLSLEFLLREWKPYDLEAIGSLADVLAQETMTFGRPLQSPEVHQRAVAGWPPAQAACLHRPVDGLRDEGEYRSMVGVIVLGMMGEDVCRLARYEYFGQHFEKRLAEERHVLPVRIIIDHPIREQRRIKEWIPLCPEEILPKCRKRCRAIRDADDGQIPVFQTNRTVEPQEFPLSSLPHLHQFLDRIRIPQA
jgi:hypothetical protein